MMIVWIILNRFWAFHDICNALYALAEWWYALSDTLEGIPFVGEYLKVPFWWLGYYTYELAHWFFSLWEFGYGVYYSIRQLESTAFWEIKIRDLFLDTPWHLIDPAQWILDMVAKFLPDMLDIPGQIRAALLDTLHAMFPELMAFIDDPLDWFMSLLAQDFGPLYWFSIDPVGYITGEIYRLFPVTEYIFDDPVDWLKYRLSDIFGVEKDFWDDPLESIKANIQLKLLDMIEESKDELYEVGEKLFRYFLEGVW